MSARVTTKDLDTGEEDSIEIRDDQYVVVLGPKRYIASEQVYGNGTAVITIKTGEPDA